MTKNQRLNLSRETLVNLERRDLEALRGAESKDFGGTGGSCSCVSYCNDQTGWSGQASCY